MNLFTYTQKESVLKKELAAVARKENRLQHTAENNSPAAWKTALEAKVPPKVYSGLESAFCKGFSLVFHQGKAIIEKTCSKEQIRSDFSIHHHAIQHRGNRKDLKQLHLSAKKTDLLNLAVTSAEGIGLGALGIGMPDIVLFLGTLLKGIYETAMSYGFDYESRQEQFLILKMMEASLSSGYDWTEKNRQVDKLLTADAFAVTEEIFRQQLTDTASAFAADMLLLKFIQGFPVVGILGGAANPVYYTKVMTYVQLKYRKRYLLHRMQQ